MKPQKLSLIFIAIFLVACIQVVTVAPPEKVTSPSASSLRSMATSSQDPAHPPTGTPQPIWTPTNPATPVPSFTPVDFMTPRSGMDREINHWDQVIEQDPGNADAYFQRATLIYNSAVQTGSLEVYQSKLDQALKDVDKAISLRSDMGDYYALRQSIYWYMAVTQAYAVDQQYLVTIALDNAYKADQLGTTVEEYPDRIIVIDLIFANRCQEALDEVQRLITQLPEGDTSLGGLLHIRSQAYACLGKLDDALQSVNDSMFNNMNIDYKKSLKIQYLLMLGQYGDALPLLNEQISTSRLNGDQYYMRAVVYYNMGVKDMVQDELYEGMSRTWSRGGWLPYVEARMALDEGRTEEAIQLLQLAEATFDPTYNPMKWKIQEQLKSLGAVPLTLSPSVPYSSTPLP